MSRSEDPDVNLYISPSYWLKQSDALGSTAVFHVHGDRDETVRPDQHQKFEQDYKDRGYDFKGILVEDFGHSFAPRDTNETGKTIDLQEEISAFLSQYL